MKNLIILLCNDTHAAISTVRKYSGLFYPSNENNKIYIKNNSDDVGNIILSNINEYRILIVRDIDNFNYYIKCLFSDNDPICYNLIHRQDNSHINELPIILKKCSSIVSHVINDMVNKNSIESKNLIVFSPDINPNQDSFNYIIVDISTNKAKHVNINLVTRQ